LTRSDAHVSLASVYRFTTWLPILMVVAMMPGLGELVDDAVHFLRTGHTEHSDVHFDGHGDAHPDGHHLDEEHGCSGAFHLCSCHQSPTFLGAPLLPDLRSAAVDVVRPSRLSTRGPDGVREDVARPPRA
jgi:hypothetical protein